MANLREIGQSLKEAREAQNLSIEDLATKTRISSRHLLALEEGNESDLPELFYIRGFLKKYAEAVGLSPTEVADSFRKAPAPTPVQPTWRYSVGPIAYYLVIVLLIGGGLALAWHFQPKVSVVSEPSAAPSPSAKPHAKPTPRPSAGLAAAGTASAPPKASAAPAAVAGLAASSAPDVEASETPEADAAAGASEAPANPTPTPKASAKPAPKASASAEAGAANAEAKSLDLSATATAWVEVTVDGKRGFRGTMKPGDKHAFKGKRIEVYTGNAGGVHVRLAGRDLGALGASGKLADRYF